MKPAFLLASAVAFALIGAGPALAQSDIWVCTDAQGQKTYQNTGDGKGCKKVDVQPVLTLPAPKLPANRASTPSTTPTPANFPRVDADTQKARDSDRRKILSDELAAEESRLQSLRAEYNNGEPERRGDERNYQRYLDRVERLKADIQRAENNIASLKRELALIASQ